MLLRESQCHSTKVLRSKIRSRSKTEDEGTASVGAARDEVGAGSEGAMASVGVEAGAGTASASF